MTTRSTRMCLLCYDVLMLTCFDRTFTIMVAQRYKLQFDTREAQAETTRLRAGGPSGAGVMVDSAIDVHDSPQRLCSPMLTFATKNQTLSTASGANQSVHFPT